VLLFNTSTSGRLWRPLQSAPGLGPGLSLTHLPFLLLAHLVVCGRPGRVMLLPLRPAWPSPVRPAAQTSRLASNTPRPADIGLVRLQPGRALSLPGARLQPVVSSASMQVPGSFGAQLAVPLALPAAFDGLASHLDRNGSRSLSKHQVLFGSLLIGLLRQLCFAASGVPPPELLRRLLVSQFSDAGLFGSNPPRG